MYSVENCDLCMESIKELNNSTKFVIKDGENSILNLINEYNLEVSKVMEGYSFPCEKLLSELEYIKNLNNDYLDTRDKEYAFESYKDTVVSFCEIIVFGELEFEKGKYKSEDIERLQDEIGGFDEVTMDIIEENDDLYEKLDEMEEKEHFLEAEKIKAKIDKNENNIIEVSYKIDIKDYVLNKLLDMEIED